MTFRKAMALSALALLFSAGAARADSLPQQMFILLSGKCLQPVDGSADQGAAIVQEPCDRTKSVQLWTAVSIGAGNIHYVNAYSSLCLDARGGAANHTPVQQWPCSTISNETWQHGPWLYGPSKARPFPPPVYSKVSGASNYCLDVPGGQRTAGIAVQIYLCNGTISQGWEAPLL